MHNKLREKREALGLRMIDVAIKSGVGVSTIWLIENGYDHRVSNKTKQRLASGLGKEIKELFPEK